MPKSEIDLVLDLVEKGAVAVEKATHVLWSQEDLLEAKSNHQFQNDDHMSQPTDNAPITDLYPGCLNVMGRVAGEDNIGPIAETTHFLLFGLPGESRKLLSV